MMESSRTFLVPILRTEHVEVTTKPAVAHRRGPAAATAPPRTVRIFCDDYDATDSSGDDDAAGAGSGSPPPEEEEERGRIRPAADGVRRRPAEEEEEERGSFGGEAAAVGEVRGGDPGPAAARPAVAGHVRHRGGGGEGLRLRRPEAPRPLRRHQLLRRRQSLHHHHLLLLLHLLRRLAGVAPRPLPNLRPPLRKPSPPPNPPPQPSPPPPPQKQADDNLLFTDFADFPPVEEVDFLDVGFFPQRSAFGELEQIGFLAEEFDRSLFDTRRDLVSSTCDADDYFQGIDDLFPISPLFTV
uniref:Uncharacterized protein n=1 Tax=Ananas comosus var. bracteatus TaxID=296719 RepID=A0A6V7NUR4_ANACO|nr:unnamed protein product [Ananas comosus var. bracteatus]